MSKPLPLAGTRVIDFSRVLAGPLITQNLADLGAEVIKIERPGHGDDTRTWGPPWHSGDDNGRYSTYYESLNRGKRSIVLDLFDDNDLALARDLARSGDVVVDNFRPGFMAERGLDRETLAADNPAVVTCTVTAFGEEGPAASLPGYDLVAQAMGGIMHMTGEADGPANRVGVPIVDMTTGLYGTIGLLAALTEAARTGEGRHVAVSLFDTALASLGNHASATLMAGAEPRRDGNRHPSISPYESYRAADGDLIIAAGNNKLFANLCGAIDRPDLLDDPRFVDGPSRRSHINELGIELEAILTTDTRDAWVEKLRAHQVPTGPINTIPEALEWAAEMDINATLTHGSFTGVRSPIVIDGERLDTTAAPPRLGEHNAEIRTEMGR
ncbi:MAG: crotonobetainyl-CoA:carnitine CoA-transferase CaiB-like acyl-CoA transferase [Candidatus Aldehydirespiratoraceae bacterium]